MEKAALPAPIDRFIEAVNTNDIYAVLALFPEDGAVDDWGRRHVGHAAIKKWSDREFIGVQVNLSVTAVTQTGNQVSLTAEVGGNGFNGLSRFQFVIDGDKVREMRITPQ